VVPVVILPEIVVPVVIEEPVIADDTDMVIPVEIEEPVIADDTDMVIPVEIEEPVIADDTDMVIPDVIEEAVDSIINGVIDDDVKAVFEAPDEIIDTIDTSLFENEVFDKSESDEGVLEDEIPMTANEDQAIVAKIIESA